LSGNDMLVYVNNVIKGKLMESDLLQQQAAKNSKSQFANSPDLDKELMNAITDAVSTHTTMCKQALDPVKVRQGLKAILLGPAGL
jgi:type I restriction enzyme R subunit